MQMQVFQGILILFRLVLDRTVLHLHMNSDKVKGVSRRKAFLYGAPSGAVEPVGAAQWSR